MLSREAFIKDRDYVFNKVYGALAGIAIGDSFGDAARMQENRANYQVTTDFNKGASWSTDDIDCPYHYPVRGKADHRGMCKILDGACGYPG